MQVYNTRNPQIKPPVVMLVYGEGGVGKSTFTSTAPNPIMADCEGGSKYFGLRDIHMDVATVNNWSDMKEFLEIAKNYDTVVIDPIGELMDKLKRFMVIKGDSKLVQKDGSPSMAGWGWLKKTMRDYLKAVRDMNKNMIVVAHVEEKQDEDRIIKRPKIETKLSDELVAMVDIVAYMTVVQQEGEEKRVLIVDPASDKYTAKDRTGQLGKYLPPDFSLILNAIHGKENYSWAKNKVVKEPEDAPPTEPTKQEVESEQQQVEELAKQFDAKVEDEKPEPVPKKTVVKETVKKPIHPALEEARKKLNQ